MKTMEIEHTSLEICVREAQGEQVLVTRDRRPIALVVSLADLDEEQLQLGASDDFWRLITARRKQRAVTRSELERLADGNSQT